MSHARLVGQLLLDPLKDYEFVAPSSDEVDLNPIQYDPVSLIQNAFTERLDLQAQNSRIEAAEQGVRTAKASFWPVVNLVGQYGTSYSSSDALDRPIFEQTADNRSGAVRIGLTIPIFNRLDTKYRVEQSRVVERNARLDPGKPAATCCARGPTVIPRLPDRREAARGVGQKAPARPSRRLTRSRSGTMSVPQHSLS